MSNTTAWKVLHLELSEGIPSLSAEQNYQGIYLVFWWKNLPVGLQKISNAELPMPASQLANMVTQIIAPAVANQLFEADYQIEKPLEKLREKWTNAANKSDDDTVSVVICTQDRPEDLARCLHALQNLAHPPDEIVVVDNAPSTDKTRDVVSGIPGVRYVLEPRRGLSMARNTGIRQTTGDIIAFTDDDVAVHPDWIVHLRQGFQNPKVMAVTGLILPAELETEAQVIFEMEQGCLAGDFYAVTFDQEFFRKTQHRGVPVWQIGAGANMAFRRRAFDLVGYFDERLGAGASGCSEDSELWYRLLAEGWLCRYEPTAVVYHRHRQDMAGLKHQMYQYMRGHVTALLVQFARYKHWGNLIRLFYSLPKYYGGLFVLGLLYGFNLRYKTYKAEVLGCIAGTSYYLQNRTLDN